MYMACKPEGWDFYLEPLAKELDLSVGTIRTYIKELIKAGWIEKKGQAHDKESGAFGACIFVLKASNKRDKYQKTPCGKNPPSDKKHNTANNIYNKDNNKENNKEEKTLFTESEKGAGAPSLSELFKTDGEKAFDKGMKEKYPYVAKMDVPLTYADYIRLQSKYSRIKIHMNLRAMNDWKGLSKRRSAMLTLENWCNRDKNEYKESDLL
jgi:hypothetical protein